MISNYYLKPININFNLISKYEYSGMMKHQCEFYCPVINDGHCRLCSSSREEHKKYYQYEKMACKIQKMYIKYKK